MGLLEILNSKFAAEYKKDPERICQFVYSKFSPVESCIKRGGETKVFMKDILTIVQTNLLKFYVELKEKDKIYQFFQMNQRQALIDARELQEYINRYQ